MIQDCSACRKDYNLDKKNQEKIKKKSNPSCKVNLRKKMEWIITLKKAIDFMEANLSNDISTNDIAKEVCKNPIVLSI